MQLKASSPDTAFTFKGGMLPMTVMELNSSDPELIRQHLDSKQTQSPAFFQHTPLLLSVEKLDVEHLSLERICAVCREHRLLPVAVRGGADPVRQSAWALGLGWFAPVDNTRAKHLSGIDPAVGEPGIQTPDTDPHSSAPLPKAPAGMKVHRGTVRSGQQVSAANGDLVIVGAVNAGAEILAAGSIHVYGALRGRALAGIHGNTDVRIFCTELHAELLSVTGDYKRLEDIEPSLLGSAVEVNLEQGQLDIKPLR